jgi:hypothetical protein
VVIQLLARRSARSRASDPQSIKIAVAMVH